MINWGTVPLGSVLPFPFATFDGNGASVTLTGLAVTDIEVYKGTSMTQRASDAGYALMDTDGIDVDGRTGIHGFSIDTGDDTTSGFFAAGEFYWVVVDAVTIAGQTVRFLVGTFRLAPAEATAGIPKVDAALIEGVDATNQIRDAVVDDGTRIDASALNTLSGHDPGETIMGATDLGTGSGLTSLASAAALATVDGNVDAIKAKTDNLPSDPADESLLIAATDSILSRLGAPAGASVSADIAAVKSDTAAILTDTGTTLDGKIDTIDGVVDAIKAVTDNLPDSGALTSLATASALTTVDSVVDAIKVTTDKLDDTLEDQGGGVYGFTEEALAAAPSGEGASAPTASEIADAVWDEVLSGHTTEGSAGDTLGNVATGTPPTAQAIRQEIDANSTQLAAIKAKTDNLPSDPADQSVLAGLIGTPANTTLAGDLADIESKVDDLEGRLTATRAGYLDNLSAGAVATASDLATVDGNVDAIKAVTDALPDSGALTSLATAAALATVDGNVDAIKAVTDALPDDGALTSLATASALATVDDNVDAILEDTGTTLPGTLTTLAGYVDTEVAAIKAKTDNLPSDPADQSLIIAATDAIIAKIGTPAGDSLAADIAALPDSSAIQAAAAAALTAYDPPTRAEATADKAAIIAAIPSAADNASAVASAAATTPLPANIKRINDTALDGDGSEGDPWGPAA